MSYSGLLLVQRLAVVTEDNFTADIAKAKKLRQRGSLRQIKRAINCHEQNKR